MKHDEREFLNSLQQRTYEYNQFSIPSVRKVLADLGMNAKRAAYICQKWTDKGWYNYGILVA